MMDKHELIEFLDGEIRGVKENIAFKDGMNWCAQLVERYLDLNEPEITTEQAWEKIAEEYKLPVETVQQIAGTTISSAVKKEDIAIRDGCIILNPNLTEPEKPEIPHWLAERIEEYNIDSSIEFWRYVFNGSIFNPGERAWILDNDDIINKIFLCGYTIEKQPAWVVRINEKLYFCRFTDKYFEENPDEPTYSESGNPEFIKKFTNKDKAEAVATLINGEVEEWGE